MTSLPTRIMKKAIATGSYPPIVPMPRVANWSLAGWITKVLRVAGMAATMRRWSDRGPDDAINRQRISLPLVLKQTGGTGLPLHENAESQNEPVSVLQQPAAQPPAGKRTQYRQKRNRGDSVSMDSDFTSHIFDEADELLAGWRGAASAGFGAEIPDAEQLNAIFRAAHSLKAAYNIRLQYILQETTHLMEKPADARRGEMQLTIPTLSTCFETKDIMQETARRL